MPFRRHLSAFTILLAVVVLSHRVSAFRQQAAPVTVGSLQLTAARAEALIDAHARRLNYVPGEVLVRFKPGTTSAQQQRALLGLRSRPSVDGLRWLPGGLAVLRDETQPDSHILAQQLTEQLEVESAEPNYLQHIPISRSRAIRTIKIPRLFGTPNDPDFGNYQWNLQLIDMPHAWDINPGGNSNLIVATIDSGVTTVRQSFTFPLFTGSKIENVSLPFDVSPDLPASRLVSPRDFVFMPSGGPVLDFVGHGTHVSSTIAESTNNGLLGAGMAYNVRIMPVKVCVGYWELMIANAQAGQTGFLPEDASACPDDAIISGIRYAADNGAKVINISLGGEDPSTEMRNAITYAVQHGAFVAIAMGNSFDIGNPVEYPAFYASSIDGAMSVAAVSKFSNHAFYSSSGSYCEIAAPGGDVNDRSGIDLGLVWQTTLLFPDQDPTILVPRFDRYDLIGYQGTSMASPHVAGLAALAMSQGVADPAAVEALIRQTAKDLGQPGRDDLFGFGLIQPRAALFGRGIIK
jgi:serine protease